MRQTVSWKESVSCLGHRGRRTRSAGVIQQQVKQHVQVSALFPTRRTRPQEDQDFLELEPWVSRGREGGNGGQESSGALHASAVPCLGPPRVKFGHRL